jgi:hypothetical protein
MKWLLVASVLVLGLGYAAAQTFMGNCSGGTVSVQVFNGNVYCTASGSSQSLPLGFP